MKLKLVIWMNMPSHHQKDFFYELHQDEDIDLQVIYFDNILEERKSLGWENTCIDTSYERYFNDEINTLEQYIPDMKDRIHVIPGNRTKYLKGLIDYFITNKIDWVHWSERGGFSLARLLNYNYSIINSVYSLYLILTGYSNYAKKVNQYALGAFAQGILAEQDFMKWGIKKSKIKYLFYVQSMLICPPQLKRQCESHESKNFIYIGTIEKRKGFDLLLRAFSKLTNRGWRLIIIGQDKSNGMFKELINKLNIENHIDYRGVVPSNEIISHLSSADVFVFPSRFDGWGMVLNEAVLLNKPIISSSYAGATHHLVKDNKNGFVMKFLSANYLSKLMEKYIQYPELVLEHGKYSSSFHEYISPKTNVSRLKSAIKHWRKNENNH